MAGINPFTGQWDMSWGSVSPSGASFGIMPTPSFTPTGFGSTQPVLPQLPGSVGSSGGFDWSKLLPLLGGLLQGGAGLAGAYGQNQSNAANLAAQQEQQQYMRGLVGQFLQPGMSPFAAQIQGFMGGLRPPGQAGTGGGTGGTGGTGGGSYPAYPPSYFQPGGRFLTPQLPQSYPDYRSISPLSPGAGNFRLPNADFFQQFLGRNQQSIQRGGIGVNPSAMSLMPTQGMQSSAYPGQFGTGSYDPAQWNNDYYAYLGDQTQKSSQAQPEYDAILAKYNNDRSNPGYQSEIEAVRNKYGISDNASYFAGLTGQSNPAAQMMAAGDQTGIPMASADAATTASYPDWITNLPPESQGPAKQAWDLMNTPYGQGGPGGPAGGGAPNVGSGLPFNLASPSAWNYQSQGPSTYQASLLGAAPQVSPWSVQAPTISQPGSFYQPNMVNEAVGTQGMNAGQDGLLQMMRKELTPGMDPSLNLNLQGINAGQSQFDNTDLFKALGVTDTKSLNDQVAQLQGSAGSLGRRFGTALNQNESRLRTDFLNQTAARNAQLASQSFEAAQGRRMQGLGLSAGLLQDQNQFRLADANRQLQAAQGLSSAGLQGAGLNLQAMLANQGAGMQAGLAGQDLWSRIAMQNAANQLSANTSTAQFGQQAGLANQSTLFQQMLANQAAQNQAGQFNAGQTQTMNQFDASQGNIYNNLIMSLMGQGNAAQMGWQGNNTSLLGILNGVGVPQGQASAWPGAIGDVGQLAMLWPLLQQMYKG